VRKDAESVVLFLSYSFLLSHRFLLGGLVGLDQVGVGVGVGVGEAVGVPVVEGKVVTCGRK